MNFLVKNYRRAGLEFIKKSCLNVAREKGISTVEKEETLKCNRCSFVFTSRIGGVVGLNNHLKNTCKKGWLIVNFVIGQFMQLLFKDTTGAVKKGTIKLLKSDCGSVFKERSK